MGQRKRRTRSIYEVVVLVELAESLLEEGEVSSQEAFLEVVKERFEASKGRKVEEPPRLSVKSLESYLLTHSSKKNYVAFRELDSGRSSKSNSGTVSKRLEKLEEAVAELTGLVKIALTSGGRDEQSSEQDQEA